MVTNLLRKEKKKNPKRFPFISLAADKTTQAHLPDSLDLLPKQTRKKEIAGSNGSVRRESNQARLALSLSLSRSPSIHTTFPLSQVSLSLSLSLWYQWSFHLHHNPNPRNPIQNTSTHTTSWAPKLQKNSPHSSPATAKSEKSPKPLEGRSNPGQPPQSPISPRNRSPSSPLSYLKSIMNYFFGF